MNQVFHQLYYHIIWATKNREPQLSDASRQLLFEVVQKQCCRLRCRLHAVNAIVDHVHLGLEISPARPVSLVVGQIKGASAHALNQLHGGAVHWQDGYGVVSFRQAELAKVIRYIATQEARHSAGRLSTLLEATAEPESGSTDPP